MLRVKQGVDLSGLRNEMMFALHVATDAFAAFGYETVLTSARDGKHGQGSLHYVGLAVDLRTTKAGVDRESARRLRRIIATRLGAQYDVIAEELHIHIEFQPKEALL